MKFLGKRGRGERARRGREDWGQGESENAQEKERSEVKLRV